MKRWLQAGLLIIGLLTVGLVSAQEDLSWLLDLIPDGNDIDIQKQLAQGAVDIRAGDMLLVEPFTALNAWDNASDRAGNRRVRDERYEMRLVEPDLIYTGLGTEVYDNTIITVDTTRLSTEPNDGFGLVCRAQDEDNGIHFYISSDGYWRIFAFMDGRARPFMPWTTSDLINREAGATNRITAVCVEDYFALYINGALAGEARDTTFDEGAVGMSVIVFEEESEVFIAFDNLRVWSAQGDTESIDVITQTGTTDTLLAEQRAETILLLGDGGEDIALTDLMLYDPMDDDANWNIINGEEGEIEFEDDLVKLSSLEEAAYPLVLATNDAYDNVVVQAEVLFDDGDDNNAYGLACRTSTGDIGRGYQFMISGDGFYTLWVTDSVYYRFLVDWERSTEIDTNGVNQLTAVCIDDYLAFYINGTLIAERYDNIYQAGAIGLAVYTFEGDTEINADNVFVWSAEIR